MCNTYKNVHSDDYVAPLHSLTRTKCSSTRTASYSGTLDTNGTEEGVLNNEVSSMKLLFLERGNIFTETCLCVSCDKPHLPDAP